MFFMYWAKPLKVLINGSMVSGTVKSVKEGSLRNAILARGRLDRHATLNIGNGRIDIILVIYINDK